MHDIPRPEYPRPQMVRTDWINLNGTWEFEIDHSLSGIARGLHKADRLSGNITVPFCPESELSGVGFKDFMAGVWYRREVQLPEGWVSGLAAGEQILLHFGAVDYESFVYVNGKLAGKHRGGYSSYTLNITPYINEGKAVITVFAKDDLRSHKQPGGKQSHEFGSFGCYYTRTTGIWQTVWLEKIPAAHIASFKLYPDIDNCSLRITAQVHGAGELKVSASYEGKPMGEAVVVASGGQVDVTLKLAEKHLWELGNGRLYDLELTFGEDHITSYFGLRNVRMEGMKFLLNGKSVFQRLVLNQGFYPDGIYTASSDEALIKDIEISLAAGFNGARLHEKAFEPRFLYHCDRMGYMVWGEHANWNLDVTDYDAIWNFLPEWVELMERDFNHPAIIGWCPLNETWDFQGRRQCNDVVELIYRQTKLLDPTRPCIDTSGNYHVVTDIFDVHDYDQNPVTFKARYDQLVNEGTFDVHYNCGKDRHTYRGEPVFVSEYGGIKWEVDDGGFVGWGYGNGPKTEEEFIERYRGMTEALLGNKLICGLCYTQLYDVEQEKNGLYTYDRVPKFDMEIFKAINTAKAAIED